MESKDIKEECEQLIEVIEKSQARIRELQYSCLHEKTFEGLYSYKMGDLHHAIICSSCKKEIKNLIF